MTFYLPLRLIGLRGFVYYRVTRHSAHLSILTPAGRDFYAHQNFDGSAFGPCCTPRLTLRGLFAM